MSRITFTERGFQQYLEWQNMDKRMLKRINELLKSIERNGAMGGIGKPEKLKRKNGEYSRRMDAVNRLIYEVEENNIIVKACKGHYED
ncbi:Txe/YoeB family addiction module toxin [Selenomonas sputigena]|uniref:Txe/YoeB family addiction module toxin n=1 Tax=Selenomonas sputigena TaxID=69823 RepID=UPI0028EA4A00|nr:Txe/YoeB family addiction module toxin [Selenomonas sputigena]